MITGAFTPEQRAVLKEIAKRRTKWGELKRLAREWDRSHTSVLRATHFAREGGYTRTTKNTKRAALAGPLRIGSYTLLMRRIWAEWQLEHGL